MWLESADIILLKNDLTVLGEGVLEGRKTFGNTMKYIMMGVSSNFGNMFSAAGGSIFLAFLPMLPIQILLNNLFYDTSQTVMTTDNVDAEYIVRPKRWDISFIRRFMVTIGPVSSLFDFATFFNDFYFWYSLWSFSFRCSISNPIPAGTIPNSLVCRITLLTNTRSSHHKNKKSALLQEQTK